MEFLETYLEIQKTRFAERLRLSINVPKEFVSVRVPSLILQPMVENAIEHGIEKRAAGGLLRIGAVRDNGFLTLSVYTTTAHPEDWEQRRAGVGIANVRSRCERSTAKPANSISKTVSRASRSDSRFHTSPDEFRGRSPENSRTGCR